MSETKKYEVTKKHCLDYKIGEIVELTEDKAKKLANKVIPYVVKAAGDSDQDLLDALGKFEDAEIAVIEALERADKAEADLVLETERADKAEAELAELKKAAESPLTEKKAKGGK